MCQAKVWGLLLFPYIMCVVQKRQTWLTALMDQSPPVFTFSGNTPGALLQLMRDGRPRTRVELIHTTGSSRSTINSRIDILRELDLVRPFEEAQSTGGRPPAQFIFNPSSRLVLGVDLGAAHAAIAVTDLAGEIRASLREELEIGIGPEIVLGWVREQGQRLLRQVEAGTDTLLGIGVGVPGSVNFETGRLVSPTMMPGWDDYPVADFLASAFGVRVTVDNDVNVLAIAEHRTYWSQTQNLLFVKAATGIGSGIIAGGAIQRGALGAAGDLGHFVADPTSRIVCRCGNLGCLEAIASASSLATRLVGDSAGAVDRLIELARAGDVNVGREIRDAARHIGAVVGSAVSLLNPSVVVMGGSLVSAGEPFLAGVREAIYQQAVPLATRDLLVVESRMRELGGVRGASALSIESALSVDAIDERAGSVVSSQAS